MLPYLKDVLSQELADTGVHKMALEGSFPETAFKGDIFQKAGMMLECGNADQGNICLEPPRQSFLCCWTVIGS